MIIQNLFPSSLLASIFFVPFSFIRGSQFSTWISDLYTQLRGSNLLLSNSKNFHYVDSCVGPGGILHECAELMLDRYHHCIMKIPFRGQTSVNDFQLSSIMHSPITLTWAVIVTILSSVKDSSAISLAGLDLWFTRLSLQWCQTMEIVSKILKYFSNDMLWIPNTCTLIYKCYTIFFIKYLVCIPTLHQCVCFQNKSCDYRVCVQARHFTGRLHSCTLLSFNPGLVYPSIEYQVYEVKIQPLSFDSKLHMFTRYKFSTHSPSTPLLY